MEICVYARHITIRSNKFMKNVGIVGSIWELELLLYGSYTMFPTCFQVPRPVRTVSGNSPVPRVYKSIVSAIASVTVGMAGYMYSKIERE